MQTVQAFQRNSRLIQTAVLLESHPELQFRSLDQEVREQGQENVGALPSRGSKQPVSIHFSLPISCVCVRVCVHVHALSGSVTSDSLQHYGL